MEARLRGLHRPAQRPALRQHADPLLAVVPVARTATAGTVTAARKDEILFIDGRKLGALIPGSRKQKQLSDEEVESMASIYRTFKYDGTPEGIPGFSAVASVNEISEFKYALSPGRYVGSSNGNNDEERF